MNTTSKDYEILVRAVEAMDENSSPYYTPALARVMTYLDVKAVELEKENEYLRELLAAENESS